MRIVERLLELARPARLSFSLIRLPELLERAADLYADQLDDRHIEVVREYARDVPPIQADKEALYRVFVNLVANALDAMPRGGRLTVRAGWVTGGDPLPPARRRAANRVKVEVEDTGTGIEPSETRPDLQSLLYDPLGRDRARPRPGPQDRPGPRREDQLHQHTRPGHDVHDRPAARRRAAQRGRGFPMTSEGGATALAIRRGARQRRSPTSPACVDTRAASPTTSTTCSRSSPATPR
mgnify:CR=1 FL=1